jgi:hypothetical protein
MTWFETLDIEHFLFYNPQTERSIIQCYAGTNLKRIMLTLTRMRLKGMQNIIEEIKLKLEELKRLDNQFEVFGASTHKYQLNPVVDEKRIAEFELQFVRLS